MTQPFSRPLLMLGAGGHAKVLMALVQAAGLNLVGVCDPALARQSVTQWRGIPVMGGDDALDKIDPSSVGLINGIGQLIGSAVRENLFERLSKSGFAFPPLIHPTAWVDHSVLLQDGVQIMAGAIIQPDCQIGVNTIINTRASVDHDCRIGAHAHIAPGATLCGNIEIGDRAFIATGATLIQGLSIGEAAIVGSGVTLRRDLASAHIMRQTGCEPHLYKPA